MRFLWLTALTALVLAASGCAGSHRSSTPPPERTGPQQVRWTGRGYLYRYGNGEAFIQWQRRGQHVQGTISTTQIACCAPTPRRLIEKRDAVSGTISGTRIVLHLSTGVTWRGNLYRSGVFIRYSDKAPLPIRFLRASLADYTLAAAKTRASLH